MIYRFTIISDEVDDFVREIQIDPEATFYDFHEAILKSVGYANDQMTSFFICDDDWEKGKEVTLEEMDDNPEIDSWVMKDTAISELVEDEKQKLLYVFDYITERCFFIELTEIITGKDMNGAKCTKKAGEAPKQTVDFEEIYTEGISKITAEDFKYAKKMGRSIKLLGKCKNEDTGVVCSVAPRLLAPDHPLYNVSGVTNGILVRGNMVGDLVFIGSGAGKLPTASAVVSDVVDSVRHLNVSTTVMWKEEKLEVEDFSKSKKKFFVRTTKSKEEVEAVFGNVEYIDAGISGEIGFATEKLSEQDFDAKAEKLGNVISRIRIEG